jgi:hypothetical protein
MAEETRNLVVVLTHGIDHELSSVALTIACGGMTVGKSGGYGDGDFPEGGEIAGASRMHELLKAGAASLCF